MINNKIKERQKLTETYNSILKEITLIENSSPTSSDELYSQITLLEQYQKSLLQIETEISEINFAIGSIILYEELVDALKISREEFFKVAKKQTLDFYRKS